MEKTELQNRFKYHPATGLQPGYYGAVRAACLGLAELINAMCPESREKYLAITKLEEVMFWANASIARNGAEFEEDVKTRASHTEI